MADLKFSCPQCGQHISCDEAWSGHQLQCPACQTTLLVPQTQPPPSAPAPQPPPPGRPRMAGGPPQAPRPKTPGPAAPKRSMPRPPKTGNPVLNFALLAIALAVVGALAYNYVPGWVNQAKELGGAATGGTGAGASGGGGGPLGEVNEAMDVSQTLDSGSHASSRAPAAVRPSAPRAPAPAATNSPAQPARRRLP